jgi:hypothetical protein
MQLWKHRGMKNPNDHHLAVRADSVEDSVLAYESTEVGRDLDESASQLRPVNESLKFDEQSDDIALS